MANRIKISGTTANAFQIGLKGPILNSNNVTTGYQLNLPANVGANAQVLTTDGTGNLSWSTVSGGGGNGTPGGSNTQIQFNDDGNFGGSANFTFNKTNNLLVVNGNVANVDSLTFDIAANIEPTVGQLAWDTSFGTLDLAMNGNVIQHIGQNNFYFIQAQSNITKGRVVAFAGVTGGTLLGKHANTSDVGFQNQYVMGVAASDITSGQQGYVTAFGKIEDLDTSAYTSGAILWLEPNTAGLMTITEPAAPNAKVIVAACLNASVSPATNGRILVRPTFEPALDDLENVSITTPTTGQSLVYSGNVWVNQTLSQIANGNSNVSIPAANGNIQFAAVGQNSMTISNSNVIVGNGAGGVISGVLTLNANTINVSVNANVANLNANGFISVTGNANVGNIGANNATITTLSATGNANVGNLSVTGIANIPNISNLRISGGSNGQLLATFGNGVLYYANPGNATSLVNGNSNVIVAANSNITVSVAGIANLTTFTNANVIFGTTGSGGNILGANVISANTANVITISVTGNIGNANVITANTINVANINVTAISNLGNVGNVIITGGSNNQVLTTNGSGNLNWTTPTAPTKDYINVRRSSGLAVKTENTTWVFNNLVANGGSITYNTTTGNLLLTSGKVYRIAVNSTEFIVPVGPAPEYIQFRWIDDANVQLSAAGMGTVSGDVLGGSTGSLTAGPGTSEFIYAPTATGNIRLATVSGTTQDFTWQRGSLIVQEI